jgi:CO dehydrogenase nickel-insertion accessory protein CooC1
MKTKILAGNRIGIVGKGGSGKSTATVLMASVLQEHGYEVIVLDADSTNVGLHQALGLDRAPASLIDYFGGMVFSGGSVTCPVDDPTPLPNAEVSLHQLPNEYYSQNREGITLLTAGKIGDKGPGAGCDGPINKIARDFKIQTEDFFPVTLVDFKAGFEDSARGAITSLDWVIVVVDPTNAAIQMAIHMKEMVEQIRSGEPPATRHLESPELIELAIGIFREAKIKGVLVILNRVIDEEMQKFLQDRLLSNGIKPLGAIREDPAITLTWLKGKPLQESRSRRDVERIIEALEAAEKANSKPTG